MFNTYRKSAKAQNLLRDPRAAVVILDNWQVSPATALTAAGLMEEIAPADFTSGAPQTGEVKLHRAPDSVVERAAQRLASGKRMYFRLRANLERLEQD